MTETKSNLHKKILIVDDDAGVAMLISKTLSGEDYTVQSVLDATFGIREAHRNHPDLIILDLMLPGGGGLAVLERLKLSSHTSSIPVIILSGLEDDKFDDAYKDKLADFGIECFIKKPWDAQVMVDEIKRILQDTVDKTNLNLEVELEAPSEIQPEPQAESKSEPLIQDLIKIEDPLINSVSKEEQ